MARVSSETLWSREAWIFWMSVLVRSLAGAGRSSLSVRWCSGKRESYRVITAPGQSVL